MSVPISMFELLSGTPVAGATVKLCNRADTECPVGFGQVTTDAEGTAVLEFPDSFTGYVDIEKADAIEPTLVFPNLPFVEGESIGPLPMLPVGGGAFLATQLNVTPVAGRGTLLGGVQNCQGQPAPGTEVSYQGDMAGARAFYNYNGLPSPTATLVDESGNAGVINAVPGFLGMEASLNGRVVGEVSILIRADTVSLVLVKPGYGALLAF